MEAAATSSSHAQAPPVLNTVAPFAVLAGSTVTNTGATVLTGTAALPGDLGVSPGIAITGFPPGILTGPGASVHQNDAVAIQAQIDLTNAYNNLAGRTPTANLTGQNLGGLTLVPGVYNFNSAAQLTGDLTLNGLHNPNSVFIFNIASTLTTASASAITLINGAQGGNVFWRVGSSATLGTTTLFAGDILALASITLDTGADITCGAAWARTGAVTLDTNTISLCNLTTAPAGPALGPTGFPLLAALLPSTATPNEFSVARAIDAFTGGGGTLPLAFLNLFNLSPAALEAALTQLSGEAGTGAAPAGVQAMNSFLSLMTNPFADRGFAPENPPPPIVYKASIYNGLAAEAVPDPRRWGVWAAGYGGQSDIAGSSFTGSHDWSGSTFGYAMGLDYRVTPYTTVGVALAEGLTNYGLSDGLGGGRGDLFQTAVYSMTRVHAAYVAAVLAFGWDRVATSRNVTVAGTDNLTADFSAYDFAGRIEGGYRFAIPGVYALPKFGITPYAAFQMQAFRTPSYDEIAASGASTFALAYDAQTTTTYRTELGAWFDETIALGNDMSLSLWDRAAWAHDHWSNSSITAAFQALPGSTFTVVGATPAGDSLLATAGARISFKNGISLAANFDTELTPRWQIYSGTAWLRYTW